MTNVVMKRYSMNMKKRFNKFFRKLFPSDDATGVGKEDHLPPVPHLPSLRLVRDHRLVLALHSSRPRARKSHHGDDDPAHAGSNVWRNRDNDPESLVQLKVGRLVFIFILIFIFEICEMTVYKEPRKRIFK